MNERLEVDVAVVGRGLIGAAAARHLAEAGVRTALIGPAEPTDFADITGPVASHYDQARITRVGDPSPVWADLAAASIGRYADLTARSGISFHRATGLVQSASDSATVIQLAVERGGEARFVDAQWVQHTYGIHLSEAPASLCFEAGQAGVINPRKLLEAQTALARAAGATIINRTGTTLRRFGSDIVVVAASPASHTQEISAKQIVLATGAYGSQLAGVALAVEPRLRTVVMAELSPGSALPCLIVAEPEQLDLERLYWTPPVRYPDGRILLKIGGSVMPHEVASSEQDITNWFQAGGSSSEARALTDALRSLLPERALLRTDRHPCVMTYTPNQFPFVGFIDDGIAVALGGNGSAAKSSDELGRLAASLVHPTLDASWQVNVTQLVPRVQT